MIKGEHYQPITKVFYEFNQKEMNFQWDILGEFIKRVEKEFSEKDRNTEIHVNFIEDVKFELKHYYPQYHYINEV